MEVGKVLVGALDGPLVGDSFLGMAKAKGIQQLTDFRSSGRLQGCLQGKDAQSLHLRTEEEQVSTGLCQQRSLHLNRHYDSIQTLCIIALNEAFPSISMLLRVTLLMHGFNLFLPRLRELLILLHELLLEARLSCNCKVQLRHDPLSPRRRNLRLSGRIRKCLVGKSR